MVKENVKKLIEEDIEDIKGLINYEEDGLTEEVVKKQARAIFINLQEHLDEFFKNN